MTKKNAQVVQKALQLNRDRRINKNSQVNNETKSLLVEEFFEMKPLKLSSDSYKDQKKLNKFLSQVESLVNKLLRACQI